jgi:hypothetical protein
MSPKTVARLLTTLCLPLLASLLCASPAPAKLLYLPTAKFGTGGTGPAQFKNPSGVAIDESNDDVYVGDYEGNRVERFDANGKYLSEFDGSETPAATFNRPLAVAVDNSNGQAKGRVYVGSREQGVVDAFDPAGKYLFQITITGRLEAITTDTGGHLWVWVEEGGSKASLEEYSEAGVLILNRSINGEAQQGLVFDKRGDVYVLGNAGKVVRYSPPAFNEGDEASVTGGTALAIDSTTGNLFQAFGEGGSSGVVEWPPFGEGPGLWERTEETIEGSSLGFTGGLAINGKDGALYASSYGRNEVRVFKKLVIPDVSTGSSSNVTSSSATVAGTVNPDKTTTEYFIEWGETEGYGHSTSVETDAGETTIPLTAGLTGLEANTTYHYRMVATNENGTSRGSDATFTTLAVLPIVEGVPSVSDEARSSVVLHTTINPKHSVTTYHFLYVEAAAYDPTAVNPYSGGAVSADVNIGAGTTPQPVAQLIPGLKPETTYHYQLAASNQVGRVTSTDGTFTTTSPTPPTAITGAASSIVQNSATISGVLNTNGLPATYGFEIGTSTDYGPPTGLGSVGAGADEAEISLALTGLFPGTTYHYRLTVATVDGTVYGADKTFTTSAFASTFAEPPAPLPFVAVPATVFPTKTKATAVKKKAKAKGKKAKKHAKAKHKKKTKSKKK